MASFLAPSALLAGNALAGDALVVVGSRPGHLLVARSSALRSAMRLGHLSPVSALGLGAFEHAAPACFTASGSAPALFYGHGVALLGLAVVGPGGSAALGSIRVRSTAGGDGFGEAEAFRVEIQEARSKSKPAVHGSMMDGMVYDKVARTAGDSIDLLVRTMDMLLPTSRANREDALRIATKFIELEADCITGKEYILADSIDAAMDGLREMRKLYLPSTTEPLPPGKGVVVLPSLPGLETETFFRKLADEFELLYMVVEMEISREYGLGVVVPGGNTVLGSTSLKATSGGDGFFEAEAFRVEIQEARCKSKTEQQGSMMDAVVYDQIARTAGNSIDLLLTAMDKLLPTSRANREDALRIATKFINLEANCLTGEAYLLADSVDEAMDGLREMRKLYLPPTAEPLHPDNAVAALPSLPGLETELFFRNLANEFDQLYTIVQMEMAREWLGGMGVVVPGGNMVLGSTTGEDGFCEAEAFRMEIREARCKSKPTKQGTMMDAVVYDQIARTAVDSVDLLVATMDKLLPSSRANREDATRIAAKFIKLEQDCINGEGWYILADSVDGAMDGLREMRTLYVQSTEPLPSGNARLVLPSLPGRETEMFFRNLATEFQQLYAFVQKEIEQQYGNI